MSATKKQVYYVHDVNGTRLWAVDGEDKFVEAEKSCANMSTKISHTPVDIRASPLTMFPSITRGTEKVVKRKVPEEAVAVRQMAEGSSNRWVRVSTEADEQKKHRVEEACTIVDNGAPKRSIPTHVKPPLQVSELPSRSAAKVAMKDIEEESDVAPGYERGVHDDDLIGVHNEDDASPYTSADDEDWKVTKFTNNESFKVAMSPGKGLGKGCVMKKTFSLKTYVDGKAVSAGKGRFVSAPAELHKTAEANARALLVQQRMTILAKQIGTSSNFVNQDAYKKP